MAQPLKNFVVPYSAGEIVFNDGDSGSEMYIIQSGSVAIYKKVDEKELFKKVFERGDFFGEMSLLESVERSATAEVLEDTELIVINAATFNQMIQSNAEIAVRMLRKLSTRLRVANQELETALSGKGYEVSSSPMELPAPQPPEEEDKDEDKDKPPVLAQFIVEGSLTVFNLYKDVSLIGRRDPVTGIVPDVDLSDEDVKRSVSRRHAKLIHSEGTFFLVEEVGTLNGTFISGKRIPTGILSPIKSGMQIGFGTLRLKFVEQGGGKKKS